VFNEFLCLFLDNNEKISEISMNVVDSCILVYQTIMRQLLPTPAESHYTFNLRDLSKIFQGILMFDVKAVEVRLYYHYFLFNLGALN